MKAFILIMANLYLSSTYASSGLKCNGYYYLVGSNGVGSTYRSSEECSKAVRASKDGLTCNGYYLVGSNGVASTYRSSEECSEAVRVSRDGLTCNGYFLVGLNGIVSTYRSSNDCFEAIKDVPLILVSKITSSLSQNHFRFSNSEIECPQIGVKLEAGSVVKVHDDLALISPLSIRFAIF